MDGNGTPAKSLEERTHEALQRQVRASRMMEMARMQPGADFLGIVARQRVFKELLMRAGLVRDHDGRVPLEEDAQQLWRVLEDEAKADVLEDLVKAASGQPTEHAKIVELETPKERTFGGEPNGGKH